MATKLTKRARPQKKAPARRRPALSTPKVGIIMGSDSDYACMRAAGEALAQFAIPFEERVVSAHRTPQEMVGYATEARHRGLCVIIAGAGGSAHLPGMVAALTELPVIGVPVPHGPMGGEDALWSIVQMPKGVPVATVAIGGAFNAGVLAAQIIGAGADRDEKLLDQLRTYKDSLRHNVLGRKLPPQQ